MSKTTSVISFVRALTAAFFLLATFALGQQPNTANASLVLDGRDGPTFPITGGTMSPGFQQRLRLDGPASAPFGVVIAGGLLSQGFPLFGAELLDLDLSGPFVIPIDGVANPYWAIPASGTYYAYFSIPATVTVGTALAAQGLVLDPSAPSARRLTAASLVDIVPPTTVIFLTPPNDGGAVFDFTALGMTFPFYGNVHTRMFVNTDGNITFGSASSDFTPTPIDFQTQQPRIAPQWTDLTLGYPGAAITVTVSQATVPEIRVDWIMMAEWQNIGARHTFATILNMNTGDVTFVHSPLNVAMVYDELMGITPGSNLTPPGGFPAQSNLSALPTTPTAGSPMGAFWEWFGLANGSMPFYTAGVSNPWDMTGTTTRFIANQPGTAGAWYLGM